MLTGAELTRYARQLVLPEVGIVGQERLARARALVIGAGGLGSPAALYLAAAGIGQLGLLDDDAVELGNLHRQVLHGTADVGHPKTASGASALARLNAHVRVHEHRTRLTAANARDVMAGYDIVLDGSDNYGTRYAVNDACAMLGIPWVYGSVERFAAQVAVFGLDDGPCYRCIFPVAPEAGTTANCEEIGVLGPVPGIAGAMQALEALKVLLQIGEPLSGRLLHLDLLRGDVHTIQLERRTDCEACGTRRDGTSPNVSSPDQEPEATLAAPLEGEVDITPVQLAARLASGPATFLLDVREEWETRLANIPSAVHLPLNDLPASLDTLDRMRDIVVYCHHGVRSAMATQWLRERGFRARNLVGGIDRWSRDVDPQMPRY